MTSNNQSSFKEKFSNVWRVYCKLNNIDRNFNHYLSLQKRVYNFLQQLDQNYPNLYLEVHKLDTLKLTPSVFHLPTIKRKVTKFFTKLTKENPDKNITLAIVPEQHKCRVECHYKENLHKPCYKHSCLRDWHLPTLYYPAVSLSDWEGRTYEETVNPALNIWVNKLESEVDELTLKLCYLMKDWPTYYEELILRDNGLEISTLFFKRHGFNTKKKWYWVYNSLNFKRKQKQLALQQKAYREKSSEMIKTYLSYHPCYRRVQKRIERLSKQIVKTSNEKRKILRAKRRENLSILKEFPKMKVCAYCQVLF